MAPDRSEWEQFEDLEEWLNKTDPSLAAFLTRQWRFRHGRTIFAMVFAVAPACIVAGILSHLPALLLIGLCLVPVTPVLAALIVKIPPQHLLHRILHPRKEARHDTAN